ncbi:MAG TPA: hypothetical protein VGE81_07580 [Candidatus Limnocylindrales bacterium]
MSGAVVPERDEIQDAIGTVLAGRMTRRAFLARAAALGLSASAASVAGEVDRD